MTVRGFWYRGACALSLIAGCALLTLVAGCGDGKPSGGVAAHGPGVPQDLIDFLAGPDTAKVTVTAFYPGGHEDTIAAVKGLLKEFPADVRLEIVDWRTEAGMKRRTDAGLTCAGVIINGKNSFKLDLGGKEVMVAFTRGLNGDWTEEELKAAVKQEIAAAN